MKIIWPFLPLAAALIILIAPPPWADVWVRMLISLLALLTVFLWVRRQIIQKDPERKRLENQLNERTEEAHNTSIALEEALESLNSTQAKLTYASKMASLGQMTAGIAHEIKNPINFVNNFAESSIEIADELSGEMRKNDHDRTDFIQRSSSLVDELVLNARKIREHGLRVDRIVQSMLLHSHGKKGEAEAVPLNEFVDQYVTLAFHGMRAQVQDFNVTIDRVYDDAIESVPIVREDIARVLVNLLNNAFQAVNTRKEVVGGEFEPRVRVQTLQREEAVEISVEDNGGGVPESLRNKIFQPFFTTKSAGSGTGLGLSLSHDIIVDEHGGELRYEASEWKGARFVIVLPLLQSGTAQV